MVAEPKLCVASRPLRLLVLADPEARRAPWWPEAWSAASCVFAADMYAALVEIAQARVPFDALVIDARRLTEPVVAALALIRRHRRMAVWLLASGGRRGPVAEALALGAVEASHACLAALEAPPDFAAAQPAAARAEPHAKPEVVPAAPPASPAPAAIGRMMRPEAESSRSFTKSEPEALESPTAAPYHEAMLQPVLTEEELRALLGPEP